MNGTAAFDAADCKAGRVAEAADHAGLPFQRALHRLVEFGGLIQIHDIDIAVCGGANQQLVHHIDAVDSFLAGNRRDRRRLAQIPIFDGFVPGSGDEHWSRLARHVDKAHAAHWLIMSCDLLRRGRVGLDVQHARSFVGSAANDFGAILNPVIPRVFWGVFSIREQNLLWTSSN